MLIKVYLTLAIWPLVSSFRLSVLCTISAIGNALEHVFAGPLFGLGQRYFGADREKGCSSEVRQRDSESMNTISLEYHDHELLTQLIDIVMYVKLPSMVLDHKTPSYGRQLRYCIIRDSGWGLCFQRESM